MAVSSTSVKNCCSGGAFRARLKNIDDALSMSRSACNRNTNSQLLLLLNYKVRKTEYETLKPTVLEF